MRIAIGSDRRGYGIKRFLITRLRDSGHEVEDVGVDGPKPVDYPLYALKVGRLVAEKAVDYGVLLCGTGIGMSMSANKIPGIRAGLACDVERAVMTRRHNDANVLCIGADFTTEEQALEMLEAFLSTRFEGDLPGGDRHKRRIVQISELDRKYRKNEEEL